ncbi:His-Xaa-Ser system radical SAM maturase HxsB [Rhizobium sp. NZLR8]|uniref:His-Xaa-Ser system radical SAM maturase HxsB n=1 Tax=Rhizobium sp. NZLR8 TaxID=2731104 RepID=UPI001C82AF4F|nr:His-Xaa-Ser system radical SAM maturase HxsB [Rhizobium sp. NZLR8]MBX5157687.1 His-Xaa-Ser system radical SAM maturase HxsB [Rhizobium sp. NZLR8]
MTVFPLRFRPAPSGDLLFADEAGSYFKSDHDFLSRYALDRLTDRDQDYLLRNGHAFEEVGDLAYAGFEHRFASRLYSPGDLDYVILVPTLRCNLACGYCQVSRVNENTPGFDWDDRTLDAVLRFLDGLTAREIKVEFQGGEPSLRLDVLAKVREFCLTKFESCEFVVCTNLQEISEEAWRFFQLPDVFVSTSLDGDALTHERQRTLSGDKTHSFLSNLNRALEQLGPDKVSALPTINPHRPPATRSVIETYASLGMRSIYLRPINFQGFARKKYDAAASAATWNAYHSDFIDDLVEYNCTAEYAVEEFYFVHCLRRVLRSGHNGHVDLRNPNIVGHGYVVIDYDGKVYPTDEARMVTRLGQFDLSMGTVFDGIDRSAIDTLNSEALNNYHPDCVHCPYQAFCGVDLVDDLSRYGRIDIPKHLTDFCQRHTHIFDKIFSMIYSDDQKVQKSMAIWAGVPQFDRALARWHR